MFMGTGGPLYFWAFQHTSHHPHVLDVYFGVFWYVLFHVSDGCMERGPQEEMMSSLNCTMTLQKFH